MYSPKITYRGHNGYDTKAASDEAAYTETMESLTVVSQAEDADINVLMKRYGITGHMPQSPRIPTYGDFSEVTDYRSAVEAVKRAHEGFMEFPAELRARYDNDPQRFMEYCSKPENLEEMRKFGLAKPIPAPHKPSPDTQAVLDKLETLKPVPQGGTKP